MDRNRFDGLTKAMATGASRRTVLKGLFGGAAVGAGITLVPQAAGAQDEICIEAGEACEMVDGATPCCGSYTCFEAICDNAKGCWDVEDECDADYQCCDEGYVCVEGTCTAPTSAGGEVDELPATGAGPAASSGNWAGAVAAGGAAVAAAMLLRKEKTQSDDASA